MNTVATALFWIVAAAWFIKSVRTTWDIFKTPNLPPLDIPSSDRPRPAVTAVVAARDEAARIELTVRRLLDQQHVDLRVIVVDDRSTDGTGEILGRVAHDEPRLSVIRVDSLPENWLGKCHACHVGAAPVASEWLLFSDGDTWLAPDVVARAVAAAELEQVDHVTLAPGMVDTTLLAKSGLLAFQMALSDHVARVNRDSPRGFLGVGAFNLVRTAVYRSFGGHEPLRLEVIDDLKLGLLVRRAGSRTRCYKASHDAQVVWANDLWGITKAMEKNGFAQLQFNVFLTAGAVLIALTCWLAAIAGPWTGTPAGIAAGVGLMSWIVPTSIMARQQGWPIAAALLTPLTCMILVLTAIRSAFVTLRQGGVRWRDTFYPLATLRAGRVR